MYRVIIVDDEAEIRKGLQLKINWEACGFRIVGEAANGREALACIEQQRPDLVITDIRMPTMDGMELLKRCVRDYPGIKTVVLSGYEDFDYAKTALQCGAKDYLLKPVIRREFREVLQKLKEEMDRERLNRIESDQMRTQLDRAPGHAAGAIFVATGAQRHQRPDAAVLAAKRNGTRAGTFSGQRYDGSVYVGGTACPSGTKERTA